MSNPTARARAGQDRATLYDEITDKIIAELEAGRVPWVQPWGTAAAKAPLAMPKNASTNRQYSGVNILILWGAVIERGFAGQSWLTFRQALSLGGHVRKGERGTTVVYADRFVPNDEKRRAAETGEEAQADSIPETFHGLRHRPMRRTSRRDRHRCAATAAGLNRTHGGSPDQGQRNLISHRWKSRILCTSRRLCAGPAAAGLFRADQLAPHGAA